MLIHVVLVSDQGIPNLVPALMEKPGKVYLVATDAMRQKGLLPGFDVYMGRRIRRFAA